jgi:hypothetical protein
MGDETVAAVVDREADPVLKVVEVMVSDHGEPDTEYVDGTTSTVRTLGRTRSFPVSVPLNETAELSWSNAGAKISSRIRLSVLSAMYMWLPEVTTATPEGALKVADPGTPVSPQAPVALAHAVPVPASV